MNATNRKLLPAVAILLGIFGLNTTTYAQSDAKEILGHWQGTLSVQGTTLRLVVKLQHGKDGALEARVDSPDQGATDIPVRKASFEKNILKLDVAAVQASYEGKFDKKTGEIKGKWSQGPGSLPLLLKKAEKTEKAEVSDEKKSISVPDAVLARYPGKYELQPGFVVTIRLHDGKLMAQATGQPEFEIFAETEDTFFYKVVKAKIKFHAESEGKATALTLFQAGQVMKAKRID